MIFRIILALTLLGAVIRQLSPQIYDFVIVSMTKKWYVEVLKAVEPKSKLLDIGIGTATALIKNKTLILEKELKISGIDYDISYINSAKNSINQNGLNNYVEVSCRDLYAAKTKTEFKDFDAVYFSGSWSLMPNPVQAVIIASSFLKNQQGTVYITQTFQKKKGVSGSFMKVFKPLLKYITTIDFGQLTYVDEMEAYLKELEMHKFKVVEKRTIHGSKNNDFISSFFIKLSLSHSE